MLEAVFLLLACQMAGETVARALTLPVPGPVLGMALLFLLLALRARLQPRARGMQGSHLNSVASTLLANFSLMFLPAGVGIIQQARVLEQNWLGLLVAVGVSTVLSLVVTGWVFSSVAKWMAR